jgi:uncharacterized protein
MLDADRSRRQVLRLLECAVLFFVFPPSLYFFRHQLAFRVVPILLVLGAGCVFHLVRTGAMDLRSLWCPADLRTYLPGILTVFVLAGILIASAAVVFLPIRFLAFPRRTPGTWAVVMLLYPLLSALPQEVVFRALFFARYGSLFSNPVILIACNGLSFGLAHAVCGNWTAMVLSTLGGWLFAYRYYRTGSVFTVSLEHGLWGNFLFTVGLGRYLYSGSIW